MSKIVKNRIGQSVRIFADDVNDVFCIVGAVDRGDWEEVTTWTADGFWHEDKEPCDDDSILT